MSLVTLLHFLCNLTVRIQTSGTTEDMPDSGLVWHLLNPT
jgi:hypothetical protein